MNIYKKVCFISEQKKSTLERVQTLRYRNPNGIGSKNTKKLGKQVEIYCLKERITMKCQIDNQMYMLVYSLSSNLKVRVLLYI